jgi:tetratricopeptide (TPR) repeat protein
MLAVVAGDLGDALQALGRFAEAAEAQERGIAINERQGNRRDAAVGRGQIGGVRLLQGRLRDALDAYEQSRHTFESLHEPGYVAVAWHQIGRVHEQAGDLDRAEAAYQNSLRIEVELGDRSGQASTLDQIGNLYGNSGRLEESAQFHRQAATLREELGDSFTQARSLSNLAIALQKLRRLDEAREVATRATDLKTPFGHAAEPWKTWNILYNIESLIGRPDAAAAARIQAIELYAAYRRDGGTPQSAAAQMIAAVRQTLRAQGAEAARGLIPPPDQFAEDVLPVREALLAIVGGSRDPALAQDARLSYTSAVEISFLLESLASSETAE